MGSHPKVRDDEFAAIWRRHNGVIRQVALACGITERNVLYQRKRVEERLGIVLAASNDKTGREKIELPRMGMRRLANVTGVVIAFSDAHFTPGEDRSPAFLALIKLIKELKPVLVVDLGDSFDFPSISRFGASDYRSLPSVADELDFVKSRLAEVEEVAQINCKLVRCMGNHDHRFLKRLANNAPEFANVPGFSLESHFPAWDHGMTLLVNDGIEGGETMFRHRPVSGGVHAGWQSLLKGGVNFVHGHLHRGQITVLNDYRGPRWAVDLGCISAVDLHNDSGKFDYDEDSPRNWLPSLGVLTYDSHGRLLPPELCQVIDGVAYFRGSPVGR